MDIFIKTKNADYFKRLGFKTKTVGSKALFHGIFDSVFDKHEADFLKIDKKILRGFESILFEKKEDVREIIENIENDIKKEKSKKKELLESKKVLKDKENSESIAEKKENTSKTSVKSKENNELLEKIKKMSKEDLIKKITRDIQERKKEYLINLYYSLKNTPVYESESDSD